MAITYGEGFFTNNPSLNFQKILDLKILDLEKLQTNTYVTAKKVGLLFLHSHLGVLVDDDVWDSITNSQKIVEEIQNLWQ